MSKYLKRLCQNELNKGMRCGVDERNGAFYEDAGKRFLNDLLSAFDILRPSVQAASSGQCTVGRDESRVAAISFSFSYALCQGGGTRWKWVLSSSKLMTTTERASRNVYDLGESIKPVSRKRSLRV